MSLPDPWGGRWHCLMADLASPPGQRAQAEGPAILGARGAGQVVKDSRTGWVQRLEQDGRPYFAKTYLYATARDRRRGWLRNTWLAPSRARREADALAWLRAHGFAAPRVVVLAELRRWGVLHAALIVTEAVDGVPLDAALPRMPPAERDRVLRALRAFVTALHRQGFRDRNLDLRNLLWVEGGDASHVVKIDSPRHRLRPPGEASDRLAREDWRRLDASLAALGLGWPVADG